MIIIKLSQSYKYMYYTLLYTFSKTYKLKKKRVKFNVVVSWVISCS